MPLSYDNAEKAKILMDDFCVRTGITDNAGSSQRRYLWTDAFAVQALFSLSHIFNSEAYRKKALDLIDRVHNILGKHRQDDDQREGWISGLSEKEGAEHPTISGLRIGKRLPDRKPDEEFDEMMEWERDGQYFHYLTRWFNALTQAYIETGDKRYSLFAFELIKAGEKFLDRSGGKLKMSWKMSTDLSRPAVKSMGAHDPLEGLINVHTAAIMNPEMKSELQPMIRELDLLCQNMNWVSSDPLGTGGLLLISAKLADFGEETENLPFSCQPNQLLEDSLDGLRIYKDQYYRQSAPAIHRLAFRECGLSLGIRVANGMKDRYDKYTSRFKELENYLFLADELEEFWLRKESQTSPAWEEHLDINAVSLASSILAGYHPESFCGCRNGIYD